MNTAYNLFKEAIFAVGRLAALILIALFLTEIVLWACFPIPEESLFISQKFKLDIPGLKSVVIYNRNQYGFRSVSMHRKEKGARTIRIICLGASTTEQGSQNIEDTWSGILDQKLNQIMSKENIKVEVMAWGYGGAKVWDGYLYSIHKLLEFQPDIVITLWGINDLVWHGGRDNSYKGKEDRMVSLRNSYDKQEVKHAGRKASIDKIARKYSQIYRRLTFIQKSYFDNLHSDIQKIRSLGAAGYLSEKHLKYTALPFKQEISAHPDPMIEFTDGLEELLAYLKKQEIETIVMGQPTLWKKEMSPAEQSVLWFSIHTKEGLVHASAEWLEDEMNRYNHAQEKLAETFGLTYLPLGSLIPKTLDMFYDDCHFTDNGNRAVAEAIYPLLSKFVQKVAERRQLTN